MKIWKISCGVFSVSYCQLYNKYIYYIVESKILKIYSKIFSISSLVDVVYYGKRLKWNNNYVELRNFIENIVGVSGKWTVPSGNARRFQSNDSELIVTWYRSKQRTLLFQGKDGYLLREFLINVCLNLQDISPSPKEVQLLPGRNDSDKCLVGDKTSSVGHITPNSEDTMLRTNTSTIKELEDFIDNSFYNVSTVQSPDYTKIVQKFLIIPLYFNSVLRRTLKQ